MKRSMPFVLSVLLLVPARPLLAQCECTAGPCEEVTLSSVAEENPETTGFGMEFEQVRVVQPRGMAIEFGPRIPSFGERLISLTLGLMFLPIVFLVRRFLSCGAPMLSLGIRERVIATDATELKLVEKLPDVSETSDARELGPLDLGNTVLQFPT